MTEFCPTAPSAAAVFYRSYSRRKEDGSRENYEESINRTISDISKIGKFTEEQKELVLDMALKKHCLPSGRALWVAGTDWSKKPENAPGYYNCCSLHVNDVHIFGLLVELAMMGVGTGAVLEKEVVEQLPGIKRRIILESVVENQLNEGGDPNTRIFYTGIQDENPRITLKVGDSREGWGAAYQGLIQIAMGESAEDEEEDTSNIDCLLTLDLSQVRQSGKPLKGFGGTANPVKLQQTLENVIHVLSKAVNRQLSPLDCCMIIDEAASAVVAGNIRRSAGMRQFSDLDLEAATAKDNLYVKDVDGNWRVDADKECLRMANHTRCFHKKPSLDEVKHAVSKQFWSGEGAIQYVPEMIARANADILSSELAKRNFLLKYEQGGKELAKDYLKEYSEHLGGDDDELSISHRMGRYGLNPCGEIALKDNLCNLSEVHLNTINHKELDLQKKAFYAAGLQVAALLQQRFTQERLNYSRNIDPIVGVSFTGLFDFFVHAFGFKWLEWMMKGCPTGNQYKVFDDKEKKFLKIWREAAESGVTDYCRQHGIRLPNRYTTVQPAGSKSLLTGASPGWHPPKATRFIRRITFGVNDPLVSALRDYGYSVIPAQSARDELGNLLDDINDPRVEEVLVEIPTEVSWANLPGCDQFDLSKLPVRSQWRLYMQVQNTYTTHNTSATLEFRQEEIDELSNLIYDNIKNNNGYISAALLARFDANETFPRLPFEPIDKETYDLRMFVVNLNRSDLPKGTTILDLLNKYDNPDYELKGATGCDSDKCLTESIPK